MLNTNLTNITKANTLIHNLVYLPALYIDAPNDYLKLSNWGVGVYITHVNLPKSSGWSLVFGTYDNNNGNPAGRQFAIGTYKAAERKYTSGAWSEWVEK